MFLTIILLSLLYVALVLVSLYKLMPVQKEALTESAIPKVIWSYWDDENIPPVVQLCLSSWKKYNNDYQVRVLNDTNYREYTPDLDHSSFDSKTRFADYLRFQLLAKHGGIWMDATMLCTKPLDWLIEDGGEHEYVGFFMPNFTTKPQFPVIENWFLAAKKNSQFMQDWNREVQSIRSYKNSDEYVHAVKNKNIDIQNIPFPEYLMCHVAAQAVMQENADRGYTIKVISAVGEEGPFKYLSDNSWSSETAMGQMTQENMTPLVKLRGSEREVIDSMDHILKHLQDVAT